MIFEAVHLRIVAVAPADLDGHAAVRVVPQVLLNGQRLQLSLLRYVIHAFGAGGNLVQGFEQFLQVIAFQYLSVVLERGVRNG